VLRADTLDDNEMVCDFKVVKELLRDFLDAYDHALCMNTDDPQYAHFKAAYGERVIGFSHRDPTTEVLAQAVFEHLAERLSAYVRSAQNSYPVRTGVTLERVRVWETSSSWAEYWPELQ
jgi:6-pyruvoyltetrahydropterin/6-carboxytetrahydropterin synthase